MADSLLQEVDEALRADRASAFWHKHRGTVITITAALILGTAANSLWQHHREVKGGELLATLSDAQQLLNTGKAEEAAASFKKIAGRAQGDTKDLALVWQARAHLAAKQIPEAIAALQTATGGKGLWADIACLRLAGLDAKAATPCLAAKTNSPLAATRAEWSAANAWAEGKHDEAIAAIEQQVGSAETSPEAKARLLQWLTSMKAERKGSSK